MKSLNLESPDPAQKELIYKLGILKIVEIIFEGMPPVDRIQKNINSIREKTGLTEEQIWECYEFASRSSFEIGRLKTRAVVGFKS